MYCSIIRFFPFLALPIFRVNKNKTSITQESDYFQSEATTIQLKQLFSSFADTTFKLRLNQFKKYMNIIFQFEKRKYFKELHSEEYGMF